MGVPPNHPFSGNFHSINHPFGGTPIVGKPHMAYLTHDSCDHQKQPETSTYLEKMKSGLISPNNAICAFEIVVYVQKVM